MSEQDVQDLAQSALFRAILKIHQFRWGGLRGLFSWVCQIGRNIVTDRANSEPEFPYCVDPSILDAVLATPLREDGDAPQLPAHLFPVRRLLEGLPLRERAAITLVDIKGIPMEEAADYLNVSIGSLKQARHRVRQKVRQLAVQHPEILVRKVRNQSPLTPKETKP